MSGSGLAEVDGRPVYAAWAGEPAARRLRLSADDWERLGLLRGQRVAVRLPGCDPAWCFVAGDTWTDPWVWVELRAQLGGPARRAAAV